MDLNEFITFLYGGGEAKASLDKAHVGCVSVVVGVERGPSKICSSPVVEKPNEVCFCSVLCFCTSFRVIRVFGLEFGITRFLPSQNGLQSCQPCCMHRLAE